MAIQIAGTNVIDNSRNLVNIGSATFASTLTITNGQIVLNGTGRIQGIDTVSDITDATNKSYVDTAVAAVEQLVLSSGGGELFSAF